MMGRVVAATIFVLASTALAAAAATGPAVPPEGTEAAFRADLEALTRAPHRLAGTPEGRRAIAWVRDRLEEIGVEEIYELQVPIWQVRVLRCELTIDGQTVPLLPMRPNLIVPPATPVEGLTGPFVYAGRGKLEEYGRRSCEGAIVGLEYGGYDDWRLAFRLGAKAVVFLDSPGTTPTDAKHVNPPANLVRLYAPPETLERIDLRTDHPEATVVCHVRWERTAGTNLLAFLPGTDPVFGGGKPEMLVLAARCDSYGAVPQRSPGARSAANVAALLEAAAHFRAQRPRRDLLLAFLDGQARFHQGARSLYKSLTMDEENLAKPLRQERRSEAAFRQELLDLIESPPQEWDEGADPWKRAVRLFAEQAEILRNDLNVQLMKVRQARDEGEEGLAAKVEELDKEVARWDRLRRTLDKAELNELRSFPEAEPELYAALRRVAITALRERLSELERLETIYAQGLALRRRLGERHIAIHITMNLSGEGPTWGVIAGDSLKPHQVGANRDAPGHYVQVLAAFREAAQELPPDSGLDTRALMDPRESAHFVPGEFAANGRPAGVYGLYNVALMTCHDRRPRDGHPADTVSRLNWRALRRQATHAVELVGRLANRPARALSQSSKFGSLPLERFARWSDRKKTASGNFASLRVTGSLKEDRPAAGAVAAIWPSGVGDSSQWKWRNPFVENRAFHAFDPVLLEAVDGNGRFELVGIHKDLFKDYRVVVAQFDDVGRVAAITDLEKEERKSAEWVRLNLFEATGHVVGRPVMADWGHEEEIRVLKAGSDSPFRMTRRFIGHDRDFGFFYLYAHLPEEQLRLKVFHEKGPAFLGEPDRRSTGDGFRFERFRTPPPTTKVTARDLWRLNEQRLSILRTRGIVAGDLELLHARARRLRHEAQESNLTVARTADTARSAALSRNVYKPLRDVMNDLVRAIVILLLLAIPFAFAMERLLVCATQIYTRLLGFAVVFLVTFALLFMTHPGFKIAATPVVIFMAFIIILLSALVIFIVLRKFQTELKAMQGQSSARHQVQLSRLSTLVAAVNMGISTMRRRPMRTVLTAVTVILLTFTVLCFASLVNQVGVRSVYERPPGDDAADVFLRKLDYQRISTDALVMLRNRAAGGGLVAGHRWLARLKKGDPPFDVSDPKTGQNFWVDGVIGIPPEEVSRWPEFAELLAGGEADEKGDALARGGVYLPRVLQEQIGLEPGDELLLGGAPCRFAGTFDDKQLQRLNYLDGRSVLPVDFRDPTSTIEREAKEALAEDILAREFVRLSANQVGIASADLVRDLGGEMHAVTVYLAEETRAGDAGKAAAEQTGLPAWANASDGVMRLVFTNLAEVSGGIALVVPVLLGGMIIFGTMLGSITDREREIYSFSALGLAPVDVGSLFFAEAAVYAVVGGMAGQILAQGVAQGALYLAEQGVIQPTSINFSSTNALFAIAVVMATVLLSAVFPAYRASKSANPGLARSWKMPAPDGDRLEMTFPFTVSAYDITGVVSFLAEHFRQHDDAGLGVFAAQDVEIHRIEETGGLALEAHLALAPFDLGVTQQFRLSSAPSEIPGVEEVTIQADRSSGAASDWTRANRVFLRDLRRQFLLWRTLAPDAVEAYRLETLSSLGEDDNRAAPEQAPASSDEALE